MNQHVDDVRRANLEAARSAQDRFSLDELSASRRDLLQLGQRLIYTIPVVQVFFATAATAASGMSGASCVPANGLCNTDTDCCSNNCQVGVCQ